MKYPDTVTIKGKKYDVNVDWRNALRICMAASDNELDDAQRAAVQLRLFYRDYDLILKDIIANAVPFFDAMRAWLKCGEDNPTEKTSDKVLNYHVVWPYIVAAFKADYGIDIEANKILHFWKWRAMFLNLSPESFFCQVVGRCTADISGLKGKERRPYLDARREYAHWFLEEEEESDDEALARVLKEAKNGGR